MRIKYKYALSALFIGFGIGLCATLFSIEKTEEKTEPDTIYVLDKLTECDEAGGKFSLHEGYCAHGTCYKMECEVPKVELFSIYIDY